MIKAAGFTAVGLTAVGLTALGLSLAAEPSTLALGPRLPFAITPQRRALLDTIRYAEGTWRGGRPEGYRVIYGFSLCTGLRRHPEQIVHRRYTSAAAGAYQFLPSTWKTVAKTLRLPNFEAPSQDMAALAKEWASLPNQRGASHYGQPVQGSKELISFYNASLARNRQPSQGA